MLSLVGLLFYCALLVVDARLGASTTTRKLQGDALRVTGNNGRPSSSYPLGLCEGDCDNDGECFEGLRCLTRESGDAVPGCVGTLASQADFCVMAADMEGFTDDGSTTEDLPPPSMSPTMTTEQPTATPSTEAPTVKPTLAPTETPPNWPQEEDITTPPAPTSSTECPDDVFTCPDGSAVGRIPPSCQFDVCLPGDCAMDVLMCTDGSYVGRNANNDCDFFLCPTPIPEQATMEPNVTTTTPTITATEAMTPTVSPTAAATEVAATASPTVAATEVAATSVPTQAETMAMTQSETMTVTESMTTVDPATEDPSTIAPSTEDPTTMATVAPTTTAPNAGDDGMVVAVVTTQVFPEDPFPLLTVGNDGNFPSYPLALCHGDCDFDADCAGALECFQRQMNEHVPGCYGNGDFSIDYCVRPSPSVVASAFEPVGVAAGGDLELVGKPQQPEVVITAAPSEVETMAETEAPTAMDSMSNSMTDTVGSSSAEEAVMLSAFEEDADEAVNYQVGDPQGVAVSGEFEAHHDEN